MFPLRTHKTNDWNYLKCWIHRCLGVASRFMEPLVRGEYPLSMRRLVKDRLPVFSAKEKELVKGSFDFIGINYYTARYAKNIPINPQAAPISYSADQHVNATGNLKFIFIKMNIRFLFLRRKRKKNFSRIHGMILLLSCFGSGQRWSSYWSKCWREHVHLRLSKRAVQNFEVHDETLQ